MIKDQPEHPATIATKATLAVNIFEAKSVLLRKERQISDKDLHDAVWAVKLLRRRIRGRAKRHGIKEEPVHG